MGHDSEQHGKEPKGKGKEVDHMESEADRQNSLASRISESSSTLLRSSFGGQSPNVVGDVLASLQARGEKQQSSSTQADEGQQSIESSRSMSQQLRTPGIASPPETFRSPTNAGFAAPENELDKFLKGKTSQDLLPSAEAMKLPDSNKNTSSENAVKRELASFPESDEFGAARPAVNNNNSISATDGSAVVALLSTRDFLGTEETLESSTSDPDDPHIEEYGASHNNDTVTLSTKGKCANALALIPDFGQTGNQSALFDSTTSANGDVQPWLDILENYHDEVWGNILPIVKDARLELKAAKESGLTDSKSVSDLPSIRRLRMLLGHLDGGK